MEEGDDIEYIKKLVEVDEQRSEELARRMAAIFIEREFNCRIDFNKNLSLVEKKQGAVTFRILSLSRCPIELKEREIDVLINGDVRVK